MFMYSPKIKERINEKGEKEYVVRVSENERKVFTDILEAKNFLINKKSPSKRNNFSWVVNITLTLALLSSFVSIISVVNKDKVVNKKEIATSITEVIRNNGNINNIKHIYNSRTLESKLLTSPKEFYSNETSLSFILNDILVDTYKNNSKDSAFIDKLNMILIEYETINPFDKLESTQIYSFNNIKTKLDSSYVKIQPDINKIVDELANKNQLVNAYLNKSDISFYISIFALFVTFIFSIYQIYQAKQSSKEMNEIRNSFADLFNYQNKDENKKE